MLDLRYHVASLSAVFIALIVGILVGVGISGKGFVDKSERRNFENRIAVLQSSLDQATASKQLLQQQGQAAQSFIDDAYPVLMHKRLTGKRIALVVIGPTGSTGGAVNRALLDADATAVFYRAIKTPVVLAPLRKALTGTPGFRTLPDIGHELGQEWVTGGATPVADLVSPLLVEEQRGALGLPVDGVVVVQNAPAPDAVTQRFVTAFLTGLRDGGVPVVGVEQTTTVPSLVDSWRTISGLSTVDDVDTPSGKLAVALLLAGAPAGSFGVKPTADAPLPKLVPGA